MEERPKTMKAAAADTLGDPDVVHLEEVPVPRVGPDEVMIGVDVAGVGEWDPALVAGEFTDTPRRRFPRVYGCRSCAPKMPSMTTAPVWMTGRICFR